MTPRRRIWDRLSDGDGDGCDDGDRGAAEPKDIESSRTTLTTTTTTNAADKHDNAGHRRRIWDDYDDAGAAATDENLPPPPSASAAAAASIHTRIVEMRRELSTKSKHLRRIQGDLVRAKLTNRQRLEDLQNALDERRKQLQERHDASMAEQRRLLSTVQRDCASMTDRTEALSGEIRQVVESRERLCRTLQISGQRELTKKRREWEGTEKRRLAQLLAERSEEMKREAAKSLEPELGAILKRNKKEKQALRERLTMETAELRNRLEAENEARAEAEMDTIRKEFETKRQQIDGAMQERLAQISLKHSDEMERVRGASTGSLYGEGALEANLVRREEEHMKALENIRTQEARDVGTTTEHHQQAMDELREGHKTTMEAERSRFQASLDAWEVQKSKSLETESKTLENEEISKIQQKVDDDIARVISKLGEEAKEKKKALRDEVDATMAAIEDSLTLEMRSARRENETAASQDRGAKEERDQLSKAVDDLEAKLSAARSEATDSEESASQAKLNAEAIDAKTKSEIESSREIAKAAIDTTKMELSSLESTLRSRQEEEKKNNDRRSKAEYDQKAQHAAEVETVQTRIADLLKRKEAKVEGATALLKEKKEEFQSIEKCVEEARKFL